MSDTPPGYPIESVDRALTLLVLLAERPSITVSEAAEELGVARSTAHRLLAMLQYRGFADQDAPGRAYGAGARLLDIGLSTMARLDVLDTARPALEALSLELGETVHLATLSGGRVVFLESVESWRALRVSSRKGTTMPAHCTAAGKVLLAERSGEELRAILGSGPLERMTPRSPATVAALDRELGTVREEGFATNFEESEEGLSAVAVAIAEPAGPARLSITVSIPTGRLVAARVPEIVAVARRHADAVTRRRADGV